MPEKKKLTFRKQEIEYLKNHPTVNVIFCFANSLLVNNRKVLTISTTPFPHLVALEYWLTSDHNHSHCTTHRLLRSTNYLRALKPLTGTSCSSNRTDRQTDGQPEKWSHFPHHPFRWCFSLTTPLNSSTVPAPTRSPIDQTNVTTTSNCSPPPLCTIQNKWPLIRHSDTQTRNPLREGRLPPLPQFRELFLLVALLLLPLLLPILFR